jgi:tetratricopeptide (TPR) repeat protein
MSSRLSGIAAPEAHTKILCLLLVAGTLAFYNPIARNQFIEFDDSAYIVANPQVQQGVTWDTVEWSFTTFHAGYWHPITWLSHAVDCQLFHLNPAGHHYVNLLLHAINAVLLFLLLWSETGSTGASFVVAGLFALHPVNVESVAWAAERKNVLSMLFFLLAMLAYSRYARTGRRALYLSTVILFALGLMAKPQIVTLPFVLLLWDYWPLRRMQSGSEEGGLSSACIPRPLRFLIVEKIPLFILAAADSIVIVLAQRAGHAVRAASEVSWPLRLENAGVSYVRYMGKALWPSRLAALYPRSAYGLPIWRAAGALALLMAVSAIVIYWRERRYLTVGWLWFLGTLVPMIGIVAVGEQAMADRFAYIPFIGLFVAVVWTLESLVPPRRVARLCGAGAAVAVLLVFGCLTYRELGYWHDDETLWRYALSVTEDNYMAHDNLAFALARAGRSDDAIAHFRAARTLHEYPSDQILKLAHYEMRMGHPREALDDSRAALAASKDRNLQQAALCEIGRALIGLRRYDEASESYREALRIAPDNGDALVTSGLLALRAGDSRSASAYFFRAAKVEPSDVNLLLLAQALGRSGQAADAERVVAQVRKVSGNFAGSQQAVAQFLALAEIKPL